MRFGLSRALLLTFIFFSPVAVISQSNTTTSQTTNETLLFRITNLKFYPIQSDRIQANFSFTINVWNFKNYSINYDLGSFCMHLYFRHNFVPSINAIDGLGWHCSPFQINSGIVSLAPGITLENVTGTYTISNVNSIPHGVYFFSFNPVPSNVTTIIFNSYYLFGATNGDTVLSDPIPANWGSITNSSFSFHTAPLNPTSLTSDIIPNPSNITTNQIFYSNNNSSFSSSSIFGILVILGVIAISIVFVKVYYRKSLRARYQKDAKQKINLKSPFCRNCRSKIQMTDTFCENCGMRI